MAASLRFAPRHARTTTIVGLSLALGFGTGCTLVVQRSADELRRQQAGSAPDATGIDSRRGKGKPPWRAVVYGATHAAADGLVDGALEATEDPARRERLRELGDGLEAQAGAVARSAGEGVVEGMNARLPETRPVLAEMLDGLREDLGLDPEQTGRKLVRGAIAEARAGMRSLRPELRRMLDGATEGLRERVRDEVRPAIDELGVPQLAEDVGKRAALGFSAGMAQALAKDGSLGRVIDERAAEAKQTASDAKEAVDAWLARGLLLALVLAVAVIVAVAFRWLKERGERLEAQRAREAAAEEGQRRERMLRLVAAAIKQAGARDGLAAFREEMKRLTAQDDARETAAALSYFLTREGLKLESPKA